MIKLKSYNGSEYNIFRVTDIVCVESLSEATSYACIVHLINGENLYVKETAEKVTDMMENQAILGRMS